MSFLKPCLFYNQELISYETAWNWQQKWVAERKAAEVPSGKQSEKQSEAQAEQSEAQTATRSNSGFEHVRSIGNNSLFSDSIFSNSCSDICSDIFLLLEHPPVYTLGQGSTLDFLKFDISAPPYPVVRIERGGEVTHHCPGQLVGYPILNLRFYRQDLHWYLRQLEEVLIRVLATYQLEGERISGLTGVWVEGRKVAAIGIKVSRWITMHGFALNVCPDLSGFQHIVPCGIGDRPVGSLAEFIPDIQIEQVRQEIARAFAEVFQVCLIPAQLPVSCRN